MKKLAFCLLACLACLQFNTASASVAPFGESIRVMEAILDSVETPEFNELFPVTDVVVRLDRLTREVNKIGRSKYVLETASPNHHNFADKTNLYIVTVDVQPNPEIGPNVITVERIRKVRPHRNHRPRCDRNSGLDHSSFPSSR